MQNQLPLEIPYEILNHYSSTKEELNRLSRGGGLLELTRTKEILRQHLPPPPARILDVGGAAGVYSEWLSRLGYTVHLIDPVPFHVEQARNSGLFTASLGDARQLEREDDSADVILLFGPLYHLTKKEDRLQAIKEAKRVLRPHGILFGAAISRFASIMDGVKYNFLSNSDFRNIAENDLQNGQHRNPTGDPHWFTTSFFHRPDELVSEVQETGLEVVELAGVEGPGWLMKDLDERWQDVTKRDVLLYAARAIQHEPTLIGMSAHLLVVAKRIN